MSFLQEKNTYRSYSYHRPMMGYHLYNARLVLLKDESNFKTLYNDLPAQVYETVYNLRS
jgi:hypothetical protein